MPETKHTPTPWRIDSPADAVILGADDKDVAFTFGGLGERNSEDDDANAQFIVRACNSHDDLLAACEMLLKWSNGDFTKVNGVTIKGACDAAESAVTKAKGGAK